MQRSRLVVFVIAALVAMADARLAPAQEYKIIHSWTGSTAIFQPASSMVMDSQGNLYGTMSGGVFELSPPSQAGGQWTEQVLIESTGPSVHPSHGLLFDAKGNLFGVQTTAAQVDGQAVTGYIAEVSPPSTPGGTWTSQILYVFGADETTSSTNCEDPQSYLTMDSKGNLYGTCINAGANGIGGVYELSPPSQAGGQWTEQLLHSFANDGVDGNGPGPEAGLILDAQGNLYGTTENGGTYDRGVVFELSPGTGGEWTETILYALGEEDGGTPYGAVVFDRQGNLYTTEFNGGIHPTGGGGIGSVIELSPPAKQGSEWTLTQLYAFGGKTGDGASPATGVLFDAAGNLWGTTSHGGPYSANAKVGDGALFELMPQAGGGWQEVVRHFFGGPGDVLAVNAPMVIDSKGNLYGGGSGCSATGCTGIFEYTPSASTLGPSIANVLNGASNQPGIVPGSLATIYGASISTVTDSWDKYIVDGKYPTTFDGVSVTVGGMPAYLSYTTPTQINFIVPEVGPGPQQVVVKNSAGTSAAFEATVNSTGPAFFLWPNNQAVATSLTYTLLAASGTFPGATTAPAKPGDVVVLWGTGFGPTTPADPVGEETPSKGTYSTSTLPEVTLNGVPVKVYGAALAAGDGGLYQIAIQVPSSMANGNWPVQATIGGVESPSDVVLAVQQ